VVVGLEVDRDDDDEEEDARLEEELEADKCGSGMNNFGFETGGCV